MRLSGSVARTCLFILSLGSVVAVSQQASYPSTPGASTVAVARVPAAVAAIAPKAETFVQPEFVGMYFPDGSYQDAKSRARQSRFTSDNLTAPAQLRPAALPRSVNLHSIESVVDDFVPPARATRPLKNYSFWGSFRDNILTFAYGRQRVLLSPTHLTTDSHNRVILTDPSEVAVHVLDGKDSFRITGGPQHRMLLPKGVAVDADDNIYVADGKRGFILVYDPQGRFLREIGKFRGESMFEDPTGIAIDRKAGLLYVLDSPTHQVTVLDLQGNIVKRLGSDRARNGQKAFDYPSEIAVGHNRVVILDGAGSRIQVFDPQLNILKSFPVRSIEGPPLYNEIGLAVDNAGFIYLSNLSAPTVRVYKDDGQFVGSMGAPGLRDGEFRGPSGLWIDGNDKMYVADTDNSRIQVFQPASGNKSAPAPAVRGGSAR